MCGADLVDLRKVSYTVLIISFLYPVGRKNFYVIS